MPLEDQRRNDSQGSGESEIGRSAPEGMPKEVASQSRAPKQIEQKRDVLPVQKPVTDDVEQQKQPSKLRVVLTRIGAVLLIVVALSMAYIFLLLGEPEEMVDLNPQMSEELIRVPVQAVEAQGNADLSVVAATFGKSVLVLYGNPIPLQKVVLSDTAFQGGYARRATFLYAFEDGQLFKMESIRPTAAAALLGTAGASLSVSNIYSLAGLDAARMDTAESIYIFGKSEEAVYAVTCPASHAADLAALMKQTTLLEPRVDNP